MRYSRETMEDSRLHHVAQDNPMINAELDNANLFYNDVTFNLSLKNPTCFISFINVVSIFSRKWNSHNESFGQSGSLSAATLQTGPRP